jgi:hypothetical protein
MDMENTTVGDQGTAENAEAAAAADASGTGAEQSGAGFSDTAESGDGTQNQQTSGDGSAEQNGEGAETEAERAAKNSRYAAKRREREQRAAGGEGADERARALQKERFDTVIAVTGGENPYTHEPIRDETDVQEYLTMRRIEQGGGDPLQDYAKTIKREARERAEQERAAEQQRQWYIKDRADFAAAYPDVKPDDLIRDADFSTYAQGKVGKVPLTEIYRGYRGMVDKIAANVEQRLTRTMAQAQANRQASPGTLSGSGEGEPFFTREQVQKMTRAEISANYDRIMESQRYWK